MKENVDSKVDNIGHEREIAIKPVMMEPEPESKLCEYEKLRERNIQERNNLLEKLKIDKLKEALKVKPVSNNLK